MVACAVAVSNGLAGGFSVVCLRLVSPHDRFT